MEEQEKSGLWKRIKKFVRKIFGKNDIPLIEMPKESNATNTIQELSKENEILQMQKKYEAGIIKENDLTNIERDNLINLYKKQIETLENNISMRKRELDNYKVKILNARNKIAK